MTAGAGGSRRNGRPRIVRTPRFLPNSAGPAASVFAPLTFQAQDGARSSVHLACLPRHTREGTSTGSSCRWAVLVDRGSVGRSASSEPDPVHLLCCEGIQRVVPDSVLDRLIDPRSESVREEGDWFVSSHHGR